MSRLHSSHRGKASSRRPFPVALPSWVPLDKDEVEEEVLRLAKAGTTPSQIGLSLRDTYGVPSTRLLTGKRLTAFLEEKGTKPTLPEDLSALLKRVVHLQQHLEHHPKDLSNRRGLNLIESKIRRLSRYYRKRGRLPAEWRYSSETAALMVQ
ncbi:MAG: 30S ribosomal protein S15 [Euryarchaeota archaeon]|nr:30S ribosomal protein S15 [Euryarchaeota archaeon]MDE1836784.1 30S ribosomal protein S15 [Euryarchaeota archaeon]MDE1879802.1 30S ribosomal protein S15 [Euryarchaeota archaeon]MDE2044768.1 30S ribosomal protein S15 [Thermoplasmata archaeon]